MAYEINLKLPDGWKTETEVYTEEFGSETTHLEARLPGAEGEGDQILIDVYAGEMPEGETAEDQAFANYVEVIGFDDGDEDGESPVVKFKFNGRNAYGFDAETEEGFPMRFFAQEIRKGVLVVVAYYASDEDLLLSTFDLLERNLRVSG